MLVLVSAPAARAQTPTQETPADKTLGADAFADRCSLCHLPEGGGEGPTLKGVVGRKAGSLPGFTYTPALAGSGLTWTKAELDRFLTDPDRLVPGTAMGVHVEDAKTRAALIDYLSAN
jgi:cytochrome c2